MEELTSKTTQMPRVRRYTARSSITVRTRGNFKSQENPLKEDKRLIVSRRGGGTPVIVICPECKGEVRSKKAGKNDNSFNIKIGDLLIGNHRVGGGGCSIRHGDIPCKGIGLPVPIKED